MVYLFINSSYIPRGIALDNVPKKSYCLLIFNMHIHQRVFDIIYNLLNAN